MYKSYIKKSLLLFEELSSSENIVEKYDLAMKYYMEAILLCEDEDISLKLSVFMINNIKRLNEVPKINKIKQKEVTIEKIKLNDIAGLKSVKNILIENIIYPIEFKNLMENMPMPCRYFLLYGLPGIGKTQLVKAIANESGHNLYPISSSDILSKYQGDSEKTLKNIFETARNNCPSILFVDEIDSMCSTRDDNSSMRRLLSEFLIQMDGIESHDKDFILIGATNTPWDLDSAILRRLEKRIYVPLPDEETRKGILKIYLKENISLFSEDQIDFFC